MRIDDDAQFDPFLALLRFNRNPVAMVSGIHEQVKTELFALIWPVSQANFLKSYEVWEREIKAVVVRFNAANNTNFDPDVIFKEWAKIQAKPELGRIMMTVAKERSCSICGDAIRFDCFDPITNELYLNDQLVGVIVNAVGNPKATRSACVACHLDGGRKKPIGKSSVDHPGS